MILLARVSFTDIRTGTIPDRFAAAAFLLGAAAVFTMPEITLLSRIAGIFAASLPLLAVTMLAPGAFGGGDIKLMAGCGFFLGAKLVLYSLPAAFLLGGLWAVFLLVTAKKGRKERFAFGPFLCMGMLFSMWSGGVLAVGQ